MASNLQLRIAHLEPQTLTIGKDTRVAALEFCVHGIVVHLRLGLFAKAVHGSLAWMYHVDDAVMVPVPSSQRIMCSIPTGKHVRAPLDEAACSLCVLPLVSVFCPCPESGVVRKLGLVTGRRAVIVHLNWVCIFLGFPTEGSHLGRRRCSVA